MVNEKPRKEEVVFAGHEINEGNVFARFIARYPSLEILPSGLFSKIYEFVVDKSSCELRIKNLKAGGRPYEETQRALDTWPKRAQG